MDKNLEKAAASAIFAHPETIALEQGERPDFVATMATGARVGVEVTEAFITESDARLQRIPGYLQSLLAGERARHGDDETQVLLGTAYFPAREAAGTAIPMPAVFSFTPSLADHFDRIADRILDKNAKHSKYRQDVDVHNLIVIDRIAGGPRKGADVAASEILTPRLSTALQESPFGEVFLLSIANPEGPSVIALKSLMILNTSNLAAELVFEIIDTSALRGQSALHVWSHALRAAGVPVDLVTRDGESVLAWGNVRLDCESRSEFRVFHEYPSSAPEVCEPDWPRQANQLVRATLESSVVERLSTATTVKDFSSPIAGSADTLAHATRMQADELTVYLDEIELDEPSDDL